MLQGCPFTILAKPKPKATVVGGTTERQALTGEAFHFNFSVEGVKENKIRVFATEPETGHIIDISIEKSKGFLSILLFSWSRSQRAMGWKLRTK